MINITKTIWNAYPIIMILHILPVELNISSTFIMMYATTYFSYNRTIIIESLPRDFLMDCVYNERYIMVI